MIKNIIKLRIHDIRGHKRNKSLPTHSQRGPNFGKIIADYLLLTANKDVLKNDDYDFCAEESEIDDEGQINKTEHIFIRPKISDEPSKYKKYAGSLLPSALGIFGNCNLQSFLDSGFDITAHIAKNINCPVNYICRILPFDSGNASEIAGLRDHIFTDKKIVIYLGFPSACYVRSVSIAGSWSLTLPPERLF